MSGLVTDLLEADQALEGVDVMTAVELQESQRRVTAHQFLTKHGITNVDVVYNVWLEAESDWPGDTILYRDREGKPMTAVIRGEGHNIDIIKIKGWDSP